MTPSIKSTVGGMVCIALEVLLVGGVVYVVDAIPSTNILPNIGLMLSTWALTILGGLLVSTRGLRKAIVNNCNLFARGVWLLNVILLASGLGLLSYWVLTGGLAGNNGLVEAIVISPVVAYLVLHAFHQPWSVMTILLGIALFIVVLNLSPDYFWTRGEAVAPAILGLLLASYGLAAPVTRTLLAKSLA